MLPNCEIFNVFNTVGTQESQFDAVMITGFKVEILWNSEQTLNI